MPRIAGLTRQYIQVKRKEKDVITFGGDQGFFKDAPNGSQDERKKRMGCGIVAFSDMLLYLAGSNPVYETQDNRSYVNRVILEDEYMTYFNSQYAFLGGFSEKRKKGLSGFGLKRGFNRRARLEKWKLRAIWGWSRSKLFDRIKEMLDKEIPVILCIPMMILKKDKGKGITFYKKEGNRYRKACVVSEHYVVITEILREKEGIFLGLSSWGEKYYVNWKEYEELIHTHFLGTILGNILYIR